MTEDLPLEGVLEPPVIYLGDAVARAEDHVDELLSVECLPKPVRKHQGGSAPGQGEDLQDPVAVAPAHEDVQIPGMAFDAGVAPEGVPAADEKGDPRFCQRLEGLTEERTGPGVELVPPRRVEFSIGRLGHSLPLGVSRDAGFSGGDGVWSSPTPGGKRAETPLTGWVCPVRPLWSRWLGDPLQDLAG